jgi:exodeoxyribonuclease V beta subunit
MRQPVLLDARHSLQIDLSGRRLIEASAGTGKTYTIANLYLRHVLEGRAPGEILVVSFTRASTEELQHRIHARLYQAQQLIDAGGHTEDEFLALLMQRHSAVHPQQREQRTAALRRALRGMDETLISTIHGFCHAALQDHALLSNRQFESVVTQNDARYWERALKDWWRRATYSLDSREWALFNRALPGLSRLLDWQRQLREHPRDRVIPEVETPLAQLLCEYRGLDADKQDDELLSRLRTRALLEAGEYARPRVAAAKAANAELAYRDQLDLLLAALGESGGERLAQRLRERFPVAMIDEFQDTDGVQYEIFQRLYCGQPRTSLTLIGDPKQAIYRFRGGDIFTYIEARDDPSLEIYALNTNWRSTPALIEAINYLFTRRADPFIYDHAITFVPVGAAPRGNASALSLAGEAQPPLTVWQLPLGDKGKNLTSGEMQNRLHAAVTAEICRLLDARHAAEIDGRPLHSGDIAVLVRTNDEGEAIRASLGAAGIGSVSIGRESVFASDEARGLLDLLHAVAQPEDESRLRRARACNLFALDYRALEAEIHNDARWQAWVDTLRGLHQAWTDRGFIAMFQQMLEVLDLGNVVAQGSNAERRLTNLSQLGELLQRQSRISPGIEALLSWTRQWMASDADEESELRLESDARLVKIVTIHKSKGLEYPVVFLPFLWRCTPFTPARDLLRVHDAANRALFDLGSADFERHLLIAEKERLAEDLRLLYVALTRARSKVYLAWGDAGDGRSRGRPKQTALGYLLHGRQAAADLDNAMPDAFDDAAAMLAELPGIAAGCAHIELCGLPDSAASPAVAEPRHDPAPRAREFTRQLGTAWRINSFSSLTRDVHQAPLAGESGPRGDPILDFPAGSHVGLLLHEILEELDFERGIDAQGAALIAERAPAYGLDGDAHRQTLARWLQQILATDLGPPDLRLGNLGNGRRLNELKFDFALDRCDIDALNRFLQQRCQTPLQPLETPAFRGLMTGIIDLVFEHRGKFYLADYKSNFLGASLNDYRPQALGRAMLERRYDLQALIYSLALHRYLRQRLPDYDYARHFGGYFYLFLRAMRPASGATCGVYFDCPPHAQIDSLDSLFTFTPNPGVAG